MSSTIALDIPQESAKIYRLFYVEIDQTSHKQIFKIVADQQSIKETCKALQLAKLGPVQFFGVYGDHHALRKYLNSTFPASNDQINSCFTEEEAMPSIWTIHNDHKIVLALVLPDGKTLSSSSGTIWSYTVVMQRFLQDICHNIIICPSEDFFVNFTSEHSFHGKPHSQRKYQQVKTSLSDIREAQAVKWENVENLELLLREQSCRILRSDVGARVFHITKDITEDNHHTAKKFQELKELLKKNIDLDSLTLSNVLDICRRCRIQVLPNRKTEIMQAISTQLTIYKTRKSDAINHSKTMINELVGHSRILGILTDNIQIPRDVRKQLQASTTNWLIDPTLSELRVQDFVDHVVDSIHKNQTRKTSGHLISDTKRHSFTHELQQHDQKHQMRILRDGLIESICSALQAENQFDVNFDLHQWSFTASNPQQTISGLTLKAPTYTQFSLSTMAEYLQIADLSENERRIFADRMEFIACFKTYDGAADILVLRRLKIVNRSINLKTYVHTLFYLNNGNLRKITDFLLDNISIAFACSSTKQTVVMYNINNSVVTKCLINTFGQCERSDKLQVEDKTHKLESVKSIALTVAQDLLILIDGKSNVYSIDLSQEGSASRAVLCKIKGDGNYESNFVADDGQFYNHVQTVGERSPIFFFQSCSCVDIIDRNFCQLRSIKISQYPSPYRMKIFTDSSTTYCVLLNNQQYEGHAIENLISDSRIERQKSTADLNKSVQQDYIGNRLLDVIKRGEIQFGPPNRVEKTKYHFLLSDHQTTFHDPILRYFRGLSVVSELDAVRNVPQPVIYSENVIDISHNIQSRVPLQLCTIEMGALMPLIDGRRQRMDHLSSKSFSIDLRAREISFSYLDQLFNEISKSLPIVGIIGRQSTGKSYLMNRLFGARFGVAAGRCTDGIWMSYAVVDHQEFVVLDCEGLFSDQRTEEEEIKLLAFLAALCDVTILSQDLGFSRYQDRLFSLLAKAVEKIETNDKLFQGYLLVAVRDISDANADEALNAAEQKFMDLQQRGGSSFLEKLFCNSFTIQPLHHFENVNFSSEITKLNKEFSNLTGKNRWSNGKELVDRMKILLVQLYTDDFLDSNQVHMQMKLAELNEKMKEIWTQFDLQDVKSQSIEKVFEDKTYHVEINHQDMKLDEAPTENSYREVWKYLHQTISFSDETKEKINRLLCFLNDLLPDILHYRREELKTNMKKNFKNAFPNDSVVVREKKQFFDEVERFTRSFKLKMCLKKCSSCDLKCVRRAEHTENVRASLDEAKKQLAELSSTTTNDTIANEMQSLNNQLTKAKETKNTVSKEKNRLEDEQRRFMEKEDAERRKDKNELKISEMQAEINKLQITIAALEQRMKEIVSSANQTEDIDEIIQNEAKVLLDPKSYQFDELQALVKKFYGEDVGIDLNLIKFGDGDAHHKEVNHMIGLMDTNISRMNERLADVQFRVKQLQEERMDEEKKLKEMLNHVKELEVKIEQLNKQNEERQRKMDEVKICETDLQQQRTKLMDEKDPLEVQIERENTTNLTEKAKIERYIERLQRDSVNDGNESDELHQAQQLFTDFQTMQKNISKIQISLRKLQEQKSLQEKAIQECREKDIDVEEEEEKSLMDIDKKIEETEAQLNKTTLQKFSMYHENELLKKILTEPTSIVQARTRLEELRREIHSLDQDILQKTNEASLTKTEYEQNVVEIDALNRDLQTKRNGQMKCEENIKDATEKCEIGDVLQQSIVELAKKLTDSSKRLGELDEVKQLVNTHQSSWKILRVKNEEISVLKTADQKLSEEFEKKVLMAKNCKYSSSKDYDDHFEKLKKRYDDAHEEVKLLEKQVDAANLSLQLNDKIKRLERESQVNCDCETDHKCSSQCQICPMGGQSNSKPCIFAAGHLGEHKCNDGHICKHLCQICQLRSGQSNQCHFPYDHQDPSYHLCERIHPCPRTCEICSEPCSVSADFTEHQQHRCSSNVCWKPCMFLCGRKCVTKDHSHDAKAEQVQLIEGNQTMAMKKHLCDQKHCCVDICNTAGICKLEYITVQQKSWTTESGETFTYDHIEVNATRNKCTIEIDAGLFSHDAVKKQHKCDVQQHTCGHRCPDCQGFCRRPHGHKGHHTTLHRNKEQHIFTSTSPSEKIEIRSGDSKDSVVRRYKIGESSQPENCTSSCQRRGRGHFHLIECSGGDGCYEKKLGPKAKHSNDVYYYGPDQAIPKKYDQILCSTYWSLMKWQSPVNDADRRLIDSCDFFCNEHVRRDHGQIIKDSPRGFCTLDAWHTDRHAFECENEHQTEESYEGVDVCFVIDTTGSMGSYFEKVKSTITRIIEENEAQLKEIKTSGNFQFAIVDYRDHPPEGDYICRQLSLTSHQKAIEYVNSLRAGSGGDTPEAVLDGLDAACELKWRDNADHLLFHVLDAPPHGRVYYSGDDHWPDGCPCEKTADVVLNKMKMKKIGYNVLMCSHSLNMMISEFRKHIEVKTLEFNENVKFEEWITQRVHQQLKDTELTLKTL